MPICLLWMDGLGKKYRQIGRDELCSSGPNVELGGGAHWCPRKQIKRGQGRDVRNSGDHGPIVLVIFLQECLG